MKIYVSDKENIRFLPLIKVIDKPYKSIHIVGRDFHDSLNIQSGGINYYNLQNGCGTLAGNKGTYEFVGEENEYSCFPVVELAYAKSLEQHEAEIRKPLEEEIVQKMNELEVYKRAFDKFIETINKFEIEKLTTAQAIDTFFIRYKLIQKECLHQARKELEDENTDKRM